MEKMKKTVSLLCVGALANKSWPWRMLRGVQQEASCTGPERVVGAQAQLSYEYLLTQSPKAILLLLGPFSLFSEYLFPEQL